MINNMHRLRSSIPYDILHGINFNSNMSSIFAYLSYFPPPPPVIPGPPPQRSWTCSIRSLSSSSCLVSDDLNPPSLRTYIPLININNQSLLLTNTSHSTKILQQNLKSSSILNFLQNQLTLILLLIIFLSIFIFVILLLLLFVFVQRLRQRQLTLNSHHTEINNNLNNNNNNNNNLELNNNKNNKKFYYHLIPYREKYQKRTTTTLINSNNENSLLRITNYDSPVLEVIRLSKTSGIHSNDTEEQEEAL